MEELNIDVLLQEIIQGPATNHYFVEGYLDERSRPLALFARRRMRMWPLSFGNSSLSVSVPIAEVQDMKGSIIRFLAGLKFHGIFSAEFKIDPRDELPKLLEVNARGWWYNSLSATCGVNIILTAYLDAIGMTNVTAENYETGRYAINFLYDMKSSAWMFAQKRLSLRDWIHPLTGRIDWAIFSEDDPRPWALSSYLKIVS
jgi:predicted ATP-grasp superfamily ATP-dependent carboligase